MSYIFIIRNKNLEKMDGNLDQLYKKIIQKYEYLYRIIWILNVIIEEFYYF